MKLYAHRGWTKGPGENSLAFFERATRCDFLDGVEFDIRRNSNDQLIVIHDPPTPDDTPPRLEQVLEIFAPTNLDVFAEIKEPGIGSEVIAALQQAKVADRSVVFGFPDTAASLPWSQNRPVRLGLIAHLPWQARRLADQYRPDVLMSGWDERAWTRIAYAAVWPIFSLRRIADSFSIPIAGGIVRTQRDYDWLDQRGFDIAVADFGTENGTAKFADGDEVSLRF